MGRRFAAVVLVGLVALTGCAPAAGSIAKPTPTRTAVAPTPSPTVAPVLVPTIPFDGDCSRLLTAEQLDGFLGDGWMTRNEMLQSYGVVNDAELAPLGTIGGLECRWYAGASQQLSLEVAVLASELIPVAFARDYSESRCDTIYDWSECRLGTTVGQTWITTVVGAPKDPPLGMLEPLTAAVANNVVGTMETQAVDRQAGWWTLRDCVSLGEAMALEELLGSGYINGYWEGGASPGQRMLEEAGVQMICPWFTNHEKNPDAELHITNVVLAPGAAWNWGEIGGAAGAEAIVVAGADDAVFIENSPHEQGRLFATDGVNVLVTSGTREFAARLAERAFAALTD